MYAELDLKEEYTGIIHLPIQKFFCITSINITVIHLR